MVCSPISANAQELNQNMVQEGESNIPVEAMDMDTPILDIYNVADGF